MAKRKATTKRSSGRSRAPADDGGRSRPEWVEGYTFDRAAAERPCEFIETFCRRPAEDGFGDPQPMKLIPWQRERVIHPLFGWKRPDGRLRYRRGAVFCPKKQGKSFLMASLSTYMATAHFPIADVYLAAVDRQQAREIFRVVAKFVHASPQLAKLLEVIDSKSVIRNREHGNVIRCLSADGYRAEGLNGSVIVDEIHAHRDDKLVSALTYATRATRNGLVLTISTAGEDRNGVGYQWWSDAELVMKSPAANPSFYGVIYAAKENDPRGYGDPEVWREANPSMGITFPEDELAADYQDATTDPRKMTKFLRYSLNVWQASDARWWQGDEWSRCMSGPLAPTSGRPCWVGADLASNRDMTAVCFLWKETDGSYTAEWRYLVPRETVAERVKRDLVPYDSWIRDGWVTVTDGYRLDHEQLAKVILDRSGDCPIVAVGTDPWQAGLMETLLHREGVKVVEIPQTTRHLNAACKMLDGLVVEGRLRTGANPVAAWNANNVCVYEDATGMVKPDKDKSKEKIDGIVALVNALAVSIEDPEGGEPMDVSEWRIRMA
jgi:phage terminase large subunit-like protein